MKHLPLLLALATVAFFTGCQNPVQPSKGATELSVASTKAIESVSTRISSLELSVTRNKDESETRIKQLEADATARQVALNQTVIEINSANKKYEELAAGLAGIATKGIAGVGLPAAVASALSNFVNSEVQQATTAQAKVTDGKLAAAQTETVDTVKNQFTSLATQNGIGPDKIKQIEGKAAQQDKATEQLDGRATSQLLGLIASIIAALSGGGALAKHSLGLKAKQDVHEDKLTELDDHRDDLAEHDDSINENKTAIDTIHSKHHDLAKDVHGLQEGMRIRHTEIAALQADVKVAKPDILALEESMKAAQMKLGKLG